eukprot:365388-Chlamydomonas_euryale.AAC.2
MAACMAACMTRTPPPISVIGTWAEPQRRTSQLGSVQIQHKRKAAAALYSCSKTLSRRWEGDGRRPVKTSAGMNTSCTSVTCTTLVSHTTSRIRRGRRCTHAPRCALCTAVRDAAGRMHARMPHGAPCACRWHVVADVPHQHGASRLAAPSATHFQRRQQPDVSFHVRGECVTKTSCRGRTAGGVQAPARVRMPAAESRGWVDEQRVVDTVGRARPFARQHQPPDPRAARRCAAVFTHLLLHCERAAAAWRGCRRPRCRRARRPGTWWAEWACTERAHTACTRT